MTERTARGDLIYSHALYKALQEELVALLAPRVKPLHIDPNKSPFVILMVGVNGVGKTTTIGKLAKRLQGEGKSHVGGRRYFPVQQQRNNYKFGVSAMKSQWWRKGMAQTVLL